MAKPSKSKIEQAISVLEAADEENTLTEGQLSRINSLSGLMQDIRPVVDKTFAETMKLTDEQQAEFLSILEDRFAEEEHNYYKRPKGVNFTEVKAALEADPTLMYSLAKMEETGGEPDIIAIKDDAFIFGDCSYESPDRRNLTYSQAAEMAKEFGVDMMSEKTYRAIQRSGEFDINTWSWLKTPADIRESGRALRGRRLPGGGVDVYASRILYRNQREGWRCVLRVPKAA